MVSKYWNALVCLALVCLALVFSSANAVSLASRTQALQRSKDGLTHATSAVRNKEKKSERNKIKGKSAALEKSAAMNNVKNLAEYTLSSTGPMTVSFEGGQRIHLAIPYQSIADMIPYKVNAKEGEMYDFIVLHDFLAAWFNGTTEYGSEFNVDSIANPNAPIKYEKGSAPTAELAFTVSESTTSKKQKPKKRTRKGQRTSNENLLPSGFPEKQKASIRTIVFEIESVQFTQDSLLITGFVPVRPLYVWRTTPHQDFKNQKHFHYIPFSSSKHSAPDQITFIPNNTQAKSWSIVLGLFFLGVVVEVIADLAVAGGAAVAAESTSAIVEGATALVTEAIQQASVIASELASELEETMAGVMEDIVNSGAGSTVFVESDTTLSADALTALDSVVSEVPDDTAETIDAATESMESGPEGETLDDIDIDIAVDDDLSSVIEKAESTELFKSTIATGLYGTVKKLLETCMKNVLDQAFFSTVVTATTALVLNAAKKARSCDCEKDEDALEKVKDGLLSALATQAQALAADCLFEEEKKKAMVVDIATALCEAAETSTCCTDTATPKNFACNGYKAKEQIETMMNLKVSDLASDYYMIRYCQCAHNEQDIAKTQGHWHPIDVLNSQKEQDFAVNRNNPYDAMYIGSVEWGIKGHKDCEAATKAWGFHSFVVGYEQPGILGTCYGCFDSKITRGYKYNFCFLNKKDTVVSNYQYCERRKEVKTKKPLSIDREMGALECKQLAIAYNYMDFMVEYRDGPKKPPTCYLCSSKSDYKRNPAGQYEWTYVTQAGDRNRTNNEETYNRMLPLTRLKQQETPYDTLYWPHGQGLQGRTPTPQPTIDFRHDD